MASAQHPLRPARCFVSARGGAIVRTGTSLSSQKVTELPHRCVVTVEAVATSDCGVGRAHISDPVAGWLSFKTIDLYPKDAPEPVIEETPYDEDYCSSSSSSSSSDEGGDVDSTAFTGYRRRRFYGTVDGKTGYHLDNKEQPVVRTQEVSYRVVEGFLGALVRSAPELWSRIITKLEKGRRVKIVATCEIKVAARATPGDPWEKASLEARDEIKVRGRLSSGGWVTMSLLSAPIQGARPAPTAQTIESSERVAKQRRAAELTASGDFQPRLRHAPLEKKLDVLKPTSSKLKSATIKSSSRGVEWLRKKHALGQHACLVGQDRRATLDLVKSYCAEHQCEFAELDRDTAEADLISRRTLTKNGDVVWVDGPVVVAAVKGHILVLDGLDRVDRNVLPPLNELLENRSLPIEDGTLLLTPYTSPRCVSDDFRVIATCADPTKLDPTLRSRFVAFFVDRLTPDRFLANALGDIPQQVDCSRRSALYVVATKWFEAGMSKEEFARSRLVPVAKRAAVSRFDMQDIDSNEVLLLNQVSVAYDGRLVASFENGGELKGPPVMNKNQGLSADAALRDLTPSQRAAVSAMVEDHCAGLDSCLVGGRGVGKTRAARAFAAIVGYGEISYVLCHSDTRASELKTQILEVARRGGLIVLEGVERLDPGIAEAALGRLLRDRELSIGSPAHPSFRLVATAWCLPCPSLSSLFQTHELRDLDEIDERSVLTACFESEIVDGLIAFNRSIRDDDTLRDCLLSPGKLARVARAVDDGLSFEGALYQAVAPIVKFSLDARCRDKVARLTTAARRIAKVADRPGAAFDAPARTGYPEDLPHSVLHHSSRTLFFAPIAAHAWLIRDALCDLNASQPVLLVGSQGVGKNKIADKLAEALGLGREYIQLHRDSTIAALCVNPASALDLSKQALEPPLVRAARLGRVAIVDEADKAPIEVVWLLKAIAEGQILTPRHPDFRLIVLANGPDLIASSSCDVFRECGDYVSALVVDNPDKGSELQLVKAHAPSLDDFITYKLVSCFTALRDLASQQPPHLKPHQRISYPYSARELVKVAKHVERFKSDGASRALRDVFAFDAQYPALRVQLDEFFASRDLQRIFDDDEDFSTLSLQGDDRCLAIKAADAASSLATVAVSRGSEAVPNKAFRLPQRYLRALRWILQKVSLGQDMYLFCDPGPTGRRLARLAAALLCRRSITCSLTTETTDADLSQRRELRNGELAWTNAPPVRAAIAGDILILEGITRAEPTLLPVLNNLLENREMSLDDGTTLSASNDNPSRRASANFVVIAVGPQTPKHPGRILDPPLRSRFCGYVLPPPDLDELLELADESPYSDKTDKRVIALATSVYRLRRAWEPTRPPPQAELPKWRIEELMRERDHHPPAWPPERTVVACASLLSLFPAMPLATALDRLYPRHRLSLTPEALQQVDVEFGTCSPTAETTTDRPIPEIAALNDASDADSGDDDESEELDADGLPVVRQTETQEAVYELESIEPSTESSLLRLRFQTPDGRSTIATAASGCHGNYPNVNSEVALTRGQKAVVTAMLQDCCVGLDVCLIGGKGCGKSAAVRALATRLGYQRPRYVFCHRDLSARDLLSLRHSDEDTGDTSWRPGPLATAARLGELCVLDGIHRLIPGVLAALAPLLTDREIPDDEEMVVHPSFRVVAIAEDPIQIEDLLGIFSFHELLPPAPQEQEAILAEGGARAEAAKTIVAYGQSVRKTADMDKTFEPLVLTLRRIVQLASDPSLSSSSLGVQEAMLRLFGAYVDFLPKPKRLAWHGLLVDAIGRYGGRSGPTTPRDLVVPIVRRVDDSIRVGDVQANVHLQGHSLDDRLFFVESGSQLWTLRDMVAEWGAGRHLMLVGNQGVGKNKLASRLLDLIGYEREYVQLHRDSTVFSLLNQPTAVGGRVRYGETPLLRAVRLGRALVVDEADKAPLEVVCILKGLVDELDPLELPDGRRLGYECPVHPCFRLIVLANRPGYPFQGNDLFRECGDAFACLSVPTLDPESQVVVLQGSAPSVPVSVAVDIAQLFARLKDLYDKGILAYPYSTREAVALIKHVETFPDDPIPFDDVFAFDRIDPSLYSILLDVLHSASSSATSSKVVSSSKKFEKMSYSASDSQRTTVGRRTRDDEHYARLWDEALASQVSRLRAALASRSSRRIQRTWRRFRMHGELDELRLVDGLAGARNIYKRRQRNIDASLTAHTRLNAATKRVVFVLDCSGSMYAYNRLDSRLTRLLQCLLLVFEAFDDDQLRDEYAYAVVGHSGSTSKLDLLPFDAPRPRSVADRLAIVRKMVHHARTCASGDQTLAATNRALEHLLSKPAGEYLLFLISDADFGRYGVRPDQLATALTADNRLQAFALFLANTAATVDHLRRELPPGKAFACYDTDHLVATLADLFLASVSSGLSF